LTKSIELIDAGILEKKTAGMNDFGRGELFDVETPETKKGMMIEMYSLLTCEAFLEGETPSIA